MKLNLKRQWPTAQTALQRLNTDLLRDIEKLNEFEIALNNNMTQQRN
ncbi:unnamed protein product [Schistosoma curassoni]|uniref:ALIX_LYPXL_bnd domain-containing protein n=1 Tax=Schistosoma curassoni TaxID=6186 RepID=A0A183KKY9_9TREM|nr:unnamed protein product [Schistosoma curassoni]